MESMHNFLGEIRPGIKANPTLHHNVECVHLFPSAGTIAGVIISLEFAEWLVCIWIGGAAGSTTARLMLFRRIFSVVDWSTTWLLDANFSFSSPEKRNSLERINNKQILNQANYVNNNFKRDTHTQ
jgi:hypothetical protein